MQKHQHEEKNLPAPAVMHRQTHKACSSSAARRPSMHQSSLLSGSRSLFQSEGRERYAYRPVSIAVSHFGQATLTVRSVLRQNLGRP